MSDNAATVSAISGNDDERSSIIPLLVHRPVLRVRNRSSCARAGASGRVRQPHDRPPFSAQKTGSSLLETNTAPSVSSIRMEAMVARRATPIELTGEQRSELERIVRASTSEQRLVKRARVALLAGEDLSNEQIAPLVGLSAHKVGKWRRRFAAAGLAG